MSDTVAKSAGVPMSLPGENNTETKVDLRWEPTSVVVPSGEVMGATGEAPIADRCVSGVVEGVGDGADVYSCGSGYRYTG